MIMGAFMIEPRLTCGRAVGASKMAHTWIFPFVDERVHTFFKTRHTCIEVQRGGKKKESVTAYCWYHVTVRVPTAKTSTTATSPRLSFFFSFSRRWKYIAADCTAIYRKLFSLAIFSIRGCNYLCARSHTWHTSKTPTSFSVAIRRYNLLFDGVAALRGFFYFSRQWPLEIREAFTFVCQWIWDLF